MHLKLNPDYGGQDPDTMMFLHHLVEVPPCRILEVGANQEFSCRILADNGYDVVGFDLNPHDVHLPHNYLRIQGDFVQVAPLLKRDQFDAVFSTSALEHFGLGTYGAERDPVQDLFYDVKAVALLYDLLKPGGSCYITVPYGEKFIVSGRDWRVYDRKHLQEDLCWPFTVVAKKFFHSGPCTAPSCSDFHGIEQVSEEEADKYSGEPPHLGVFVHLKKNSVAGEKIIA